MRKKNQPGCKCCCSTGQITVTVSDGCSGLALAGVTVVLKLAGVTIATQTTNGSGVTVFTGLSPGTYTLTYTLTGYTTVGPNNITIDGSCNPTTASAMMGCTSPNVCQLVGVQGCDNTAAPNGTIVTLAQGASSWTVTTTGGGGHACIPGGVSTTATVSGVSRFDTTVLTFTSGSVATVHLTVSSGYTCMCDTCFYPVANTLHWTSAALGSVTLTYDGVSSWTGSVVKTVSNGLSTCTETIDIILCYTGSTVTTPIIHIGSSSNPLCFPFGVITTSFTITCGTPTGFLVSGTWPGGGGVFSSESFTITE